MSTYIPGAIWTGQVPFETDNSWVLDGIAAFNKAVNKNLWIPRTNEANYVTFKKAEHHRSDIGKKGGKQSVDYSESLTTLHHEMCHALSLGHENFHTKWPLRGAVLDLTTIHKQAFEASMNKYTDYGDFDAKSIMLYPNERFGLKADDSRFVYRTLNKELSDADIKLIRLMCNPSAPDLTTVLTGSK